MSALELLRQLADCRGAVWRVRARGPLGRVELSASFGALPEGVTSGYDGGQGLAAVSLSDAGTGTVLTLGGPDEEDDCLVDYLDGDRGIRWTLPPLARGERRVLHAAASRWTPAPDEDAEDISTWWAVLVSAGHILGSVPAGPV